ncbi:hypothetical protein OAK24_00875, partial [Flavobacteriales bacterium]|nr:hypothetical protein [Flavobacteriales bacterium]
MYSNSIKKNPKILLGYLMALAMVFFTNSAVAQGPANDDLANAEAIACGGSSVGTLVGATADDAATTSGSDIWYSFAGNGDDVTVSLCGTGFDTKLRIYDANMTEIAFNDDGCSGFGSGSNFASEASFSSLVGEAYSICVSPYGSWTTVGDVLISVTCVTPVSCTLDEVTLTLSDQYSDTWDGAFLTIDGVDYNMDYGNATQSYTLCLDLSGCISVTYTAGSYPNEHSWDISDASGSLASGSPGAQNAVFGSGCGVAGCTNSAACNYNSLATTDDNSCTYAVAGFDCAGNCLNGGTSTTIENRESGVYSFGLYGGTWSLTDDQGTVLASDLDGDIVTLCLPDGCYDIAGSSGSGSAYPWTYNVNGGAFVFASDAGSGAGSDQFTVGAGSCVP